MLTDQARTQLMAACATRSWSEVRVWARRREQAEAFVAEMAELVTDGALPEGGICMVSDTAEAAVRGADVVICTTTATSAVLETAWLSPGTHVTNVGPKFSDGAELPLDLYASADVVCTDAVLQCQSIGDRFVLSDAAGGTGTAEAMQSLPEIIAAAAGGAGTPSLGRQSDNDITLFISMGLAGTEVALAAEHLDAASLAKL